MLVAADATSPRFSFACPSTPEGSSSTVAPLPRCSEAVFSALEALFARSPHDCLPILVFAATNARSLVFHGQFVVVEHAYGDRVTLMIRSEALLSPRPVPPPLPPPRPPPPPPPVSTAQPRCGAAPAPSTPKLDELASRYSSFCVDVVAKAVGVAPSTAGADASSPVDKLRRIQTALSNSPPHAFPFAGRGRHSLEEALRAADAAVRQHAAASSSDELQSTCEEVRLLQKHLHGTAPALCITTRRAASHAASCPGGDCGGAAPPPGPQGAFTERSAGEGAREAGGEGGARRCGGGREGEDEAGGGGSGDGGNEAQKLHWKTIQAAERRATAAAAAAAVAAPGAQAAGAPPPAPPPPAAAPLPAPPRPRLHRAAAPGAEARSLCDLQPAVQDALFMAWHGIDAADLGRARDKVGKVTFGSRDMKECVAQCAAAVGGDAALL